MYVPKPFTEENPDVLAALIEGFSFALLITGGDGAPVGSHIPLLLERAEPGPARLLGHLARANEQWRSFDGETEALAVFQGPHAYISPNWYESANMVPTWNYAAVHAYGAPRIIDDTDEVLALLARLTDTFENDATGNWSMDQVDGDTAKGMTKGVVAFEMPISRLEGKWKMSQNRRPEDARGAIAGLESMDNAEAIRVASEMKRYL